MNGSYGVLNTLTWGRKMHKYQDCRQSYGVWTQEFKEFRTWSFCQHGICTLLHMTVSNLSILFFSVPEAMSDLVICKLSECTCTVAGGKEIILLCEKVAKGKKTVVIYLHCFYCYYLQKFAL